MEAARGGESCGYNAVLEGKRREANGVIFEIEIFQAPFRGEFARRHQRRAADGVWTGVAFGKREKLRIAPHVEVASGESFAADGFLQGIVIVGDFEGGEAIFAERTGDVAPGFAAFATSEFIVDRHLKPLLIETRNA